MKRTYLVQAANAEPESDAELWALLRSDPAAGLALAYDRHAGLVYGLARRILVNARDAEDLTQEVFVSLLTREDYDAGRGTLATFLATVTRTRAIDRWRAAKRARSALDRHAGEVSEEVEPAAGIALETSQDAEVVRSALATLPPAQRQVLEMAYFRGLSQAEIAASIGTPLGTVKSWTRSALMSLRAKLKDRQGG